MLHERQRAERDPGQKEEGWPGKEGGQALGCWQAGGEIPPLPRQHAPSQGGPDAPVQRLRRGCARRRHRSGERGDPEGQEDLPQLPQVVRAAEGSAAVPLGTKPPAKSWGHFYFLEYFKIKNLELEEGISDIQKFLKRATMDAEKQGENNDKK